MFQAKGVHWLMDKKARPVSMLSNKDLPLQIQGYKQTESERMEKHIPCKWKCMEIPLLRGKLEQEY